MKTYEQDCIVTINGKEIKNFSDAGVIVNKYYNVVDLSLYPETHSDYSLNTVRVDTPEASLFVYKGSDTHKMLLLDGGSTKITVSLRKENNYESIL